MIYSGRLHLQIIKPATGEVVNFPAGEKAEADLIAICTEEIVALGVGLFRTEAHVKADIAAGLIAAFSTFKARTAGR